MRLHHLRLNSRSCLCVHVCSVLVEVILRTSVILAANEWGQMPIRLRIGRPESSRRGPCVRAWHAQHVVAVFVGEPVRVRARCRMTTLFPNLYEHILLSRRNLGGERAQLFLDVGAVVPQWIALASRARERVGVECPRP